jgi:hypothetical protein
MSNTRYDVSWRKFAAVAGTAFVLAAVSGLVTSGPRAAGSVRAHATDHASHGASRPVSQIATVKLPSPYVQPASFDISSFDPATQTDYLSDRSNQGVDAINARANSFAGAIGSGLFAGPGTAASPSQKSTCGADGVAGPNGNVTLRIGGVTQLFASDGVTAASPSSSVKVFSLSGPGKGTLAATIPTGGVCRADELAYDPADRLLMVANDLDSPPYVSFISVNRDPTKDTVVGRITFPHAIDGLEQSGWDPQRHVFYLNVPQVPSANGSWVGEVAVISPRAKSVARTFRVRGCSPAGLALDTKAQQLLLGCSGDAITGDSVAGVTYHPNRAVTLVLNARNGRVVARINQVSGSDEVWFDPGTRRYYLAAETMTSNGRATGYPTPVLGVISAGDNRWIQSFPTAPAAHSIAVDPANGRVFAPIPSYGIAVFRAR